MQTLLEYMQIADYNDLERAANLLERDLSHVLSRQHNQANPVSRFPQEELNHKLGEAIKRLEAARTGLGLANKLKNPEDQRKNKSRIMKNLNLLRMIVQHITHELAQDNQDVVRSNNRVMDDGQVAESLDALADAAEEHARTASPGKRVATRSGNSAPADMNDNPFESRTRKAVKKVAAKVKSVIKK